jgi:hypothetical protein
MSRATVTVVVAVDVPAAFRQVNVTVKGPADPYALMAAVPVAVPPSPKFQS